MQKIILSIPEPCHENWQQMTPTEKGKFCGSCQKEVIDFTGMTDAELFAFFAQKNIGSVCGRTHSSQLDTTIAKPVVYKKKRFWYFQYIATFLLLLTRPGGSIKAQIKPPTTTSPIRPIVGKIAPVQQPQPSTRLMYGKVKDVNGNPIVNASVNVKGNIKDVTTTDAKGNYWTNVQDGDILQFIAAGYDNIEIAVKNKLGNINVTLTAAQFLLSDVIVGNISYTEDEAIGYTAPHYKTLLQIRDKENGSSIANATISISRNSISNLKDVYSNSNGEYLLRKIKKGDIYTITVLASSYQSSSITINSNSLIKVKNIRSIQLEKEMKPTHITIGQMIPTPFTNKINLCPDPTKSISIIAGGISVTDIAKEKPSQIFTPIKKIVDTLFTSIKSKTTPVTLDAPISIYPNPINKNGMLTITFDKVNKGSYNLQLFNTAGSLVQQQQISIPAEQFNFQWQLDKQVATGNYIIIVNNSKGEQSYQGKITIL